MKIEASLHNIHTNPFKASKSLQKWGHLCFHPNNSYARLLYGPFDFPDGPAAVQY